MHARLVREDLLRPQGDAHGLVRGQTECLVHGVGVQRLAAAQYARHRLVGHAHDVVLRLLSGQADAGRLGVRAEPPRLGVLS